MSYTHGNGVDHYGRTIINVGGNGGYGKLNDEVRKNFNWREIWNVYSRTPIE